MRILTAAAVLGLLIGSQVVSAQDKLPESESARPSSTPSADESAAAIAAARKKADALVEARQRKMERVVRSICVGC